MKRLGAGMHLMERLFSLSILAAALSAPFTANSQPAPPPPSSENPFAPALTAYERGDYLTYVRVIIPLAYEGIDVAQFSLGSAYAFGQGVPQDYAEAARWYRKAADQGLAQAQASLCRMFFLGRGIPQDYASALKLCRLAADQGDAGAQFTLGVMYDEGKGVSKSDVLAHKWYNLAVPNIANPDVRAMAVKSRSDAEARMTPAQVGEAQRLAREWKPTIADAGAADMPPH